MTFKTKLIPTQEQQAVIDTAKLGKNIAVKAYAGAAKTSTCIMIAEAVKKNSLYIAFNKSIADEAAEKFPMHVTCKTLHSIAWAAVVRGTPFAKKLQGFYDFREIRGLISGIDSTLDYNKEGIFVNLVVRSIKEWCQSDYYDLVKFVEDFYKVLLEEEELSVVVSFPTMLAATMTVWQSMIDPKGIKMTHDIYLKMYHLSKPKLDYSVIYLDEGQDSNPVTLDIFLRQEHAQLIIVGDSFQAIYGWRGAVNAFDSIPENWEHLYLTESFRFGDNISKPANIVLSHLGAELPLIGRGVKTEVEDSAILVRNNSTLFSYMLELAKQKKYFYVVGDTNELFSALYTASAMKFTKQGEKPNLPKWPHKQIASYGTYEELIKDENPEIQRIVKFLDICVPTVHAVVTQIKEFLVTDKLIEETRAEYEITLCTGHKSKGLEWDDVFLASDFAPRFKEDEEEEETLRKFKESQGYELLYVAITRARVNLDLDPELQSFLAGLSKD